ncbi:hypothetical protein C8R46DRAFT_1221866 [Mycena filopes]|nr:hypothetical protein C8R46DRAFT_1221866 [Mycena filopes]
MTPAASSNGSSSATALPSHSVTSSKSRSYMPFDIYDEPERGRSLSRSSSHSSSSSGSSGVIVLPTPSSIDGQSSTGSHYPRSYGYGHGVPGRMMPPSVSTPYNPTYLYQVDGRSGLVSGTVQAQQSAVDAPSQAPTTESTAQQPPKSDSAPLPVPLGDAWGLFRPRSPSSPRASSPGLFGPRSPRASSPGLFGPRSPPSVATLLPTLLHTPMSSITENVPVPVAQAQAIPHPYSQHIDRQPPPPSVSYYAYWPPMKVEQQTPRIPVEEPFAATSVDHASAPGPGPPSAFARQQPPQPASSPCPACRRSPLAQLSFSFSTPLCLSDDLSPPSSDCHRLWPRSSSLHAFPPLFHSFPLSLSLPFP